MKVEQAKNLFFFLCDIRLISFIYLLTKSVADVKINKPQQNCGFDFQNFPIVSKNQKSYENRSIKLSELRRGRVQR